jgi:hypothetical protein
MFDYIDTHKTTEYYNLPDTINVNRAPTSDSVRLLKEMEEAALKKIVSEIRVQDNSFNFVAEVYKDHLCFQDKLLVKYSINSMEDSITIELPNRYEAINNDEYIRLIYKRLCDRLAENVLKEVYKRGQLNDRYR